MEHYDVVVVGASAGGFSAAVAAAESDSRLSVLLIGDEDRLPYKRTKVSKNIAQGFSRDDFALAHNLFTESNAPISYRRQTRAIAVDRDSGTVVLEAVDDGERTAEVGYRRLVLATGSRPRDTWMPKGPGHPQTPPHGIALPGAHFAYTAAQVERLRAAALGAESALVLGLGVLGVEVAEQLALMGIDVELAGRSTGVMTRELDHYASGRLRGLLESKGITVTTQAAPVRVAAAGPSDGPAEQAVTRGSGGGRSALAFSERMGPFVVDFAEGTSRRYDLLVATLGIDRNIELAAEAGLETAVGTRVEPSLATSDPTVFACGDCLEFRDGGMNHLWRHGEQQGKMAGKNVVASLAGNQLTSYPRLPFRLKCSVFDDYYYSINSPSPMEFANGDLAFVVFSPAADERYPARKEDAYLKAFHRSGIVTGIIMAGDSDNQKAYTRAVHERYTVERLADEFLLR